MGMLELQRFLKEAMGKYQPEVWAIAFLNQYIFTCPLDLEDEDSLEYVKQDIRETLDNIALNFDFLWGDLDGKE